MCLMCCCFFSVAAQCQGVSTKQLEACRCPLQRKGGCSDSKSGSPASWSSPPETIKGTVSYCPDCVIYIRAFSALLDSHGGGGQGSYVVLLISTAVTLEAGGGGACRKPFECRKNRPLSQHMNFSALTLTMPLGICLWPASK